jgi:cell division protein FtsN
MKCFISIIALSLICSLAYAVDESSLPGGTIINLDEMTPTVVETKVTTETTEQPKLKTVAEPVQTEKVATASTVLKYDNKNAVYTVQLGAFKARERAFLLYWQMSKKVSPLQVTAPLPKDQLYRVRYGSYPNRSEAQSAAEKLRKKGIECFVTTLKTMEIIPFKKGE